MKPGKHMAICEVEWAVSTDPVPYSDAIHAMEARASAIAEGRERELVWLLEHPCVVTAGTSARIEDLKQAGRFAVHWTGRGGQFTYHGPGQRVIYVMLNVRERFGTDVRAFVTALEVWIIKTLGVLGVEGFRREGLVGVWTRDGNGRADDGQSAKIAALGVRVTRGISLHGLSLNVSPDLEHYTAIVPCGLAHSRVTSLSALGRPTPISAVDNALAAAFRECFGPVELVGCAQPTPET